MRLLYSTRDYVFRKRSEDFHGDCTSCIEFAALTLIQKEADRNEILFQDSGDLLASYDEIGSKRAKETEPTGTKASYEIVSLLAVRAVEDESDTLA